MSRDFFSVSSILQAENSAAAAASWENVKEALQKAVSDPHHIAVFSVRVNKSEFVIIDYCGVKRPNGPGLVSTSSTIDGDQVPQFQRLPYVVNPLHPC